MSGPEEDPPVMRGRDICLAEDGEWLLECCTTHPDTCCSFQLPDQCVVTTVNTRHFCLRVLIYVGITHDGSAYSLADLGEPDYVLNILSDRAHPGPYPNDIPYVWGDCVSYVPCAIVDDFSCVPDGTDVYDAIASLDDGCVPEPGEPHTLHIRLDVFRRDTGGHGEDGYVKASGIVIREGSSSSSSSIPEGG